MTQPDNNPTTFLTQKQVEDAIHYATDVAAVTRAREMVDQWIEAHPDDTFIMEAAESLEIKAAILKLPPYENIERRPSG